LSFNTIMLEKKGNIAKIVLNRPNRLNAINKALRSDLYAALENIRSDNEMKVVIVTGAPRVRIRQGKKEVKYSFSSGADITEFMKPREGEPPIEIMTYIEEYEKPVIAMVNGYALGGGTELALACDFIFASENSEFGQTEINLGFLPGWGGTQRLPRRVGISQAKRLIMTGDRISAIEAEKIGLVDIIVPMEKLEETVLAFASKLATKAPIAVRLIKSVIRRGITMDMKKGLKLEREAVDTCMRTEDFREGVKAFMEKRSPIYKGK